MHYSEKDDQWYVSLYKRWRRLMETIWIKEDERTVDRIQVFDGSGHLVYTAAFQDYEELRGRYLSRRIVLSDKERRLLSLEVEGFWDNLEVPGEAFTLPASCR
jgi:hypothetical protein